MMKDYWNEPSFPIKKLNKKKICILVLIVVCIILALTVILIYKNNSNVREWIDKNIFRKEVMQDKVATIELKEDQNSNIYAFNRYIGILNKNKFSIYGGTGNEETNLEIQISNPIFDSANRFLAIGENKGQKVYLISDKSIAWESQIEGNIAQVHVNKNGYVAVVIVDTVHKTVISVYDPQGNEMFKTFLSSTRTVDVSISNDNKYLAIAEVDTSGTIVQSNIKVVSVEKAKSDPTNSIEKNYQGEAGKLIVNIKYQDKNRLVCMYTNSINIIENDENKIIYNNEGKKVILQSVELDNYVTAIEEKSSGLFTADSLVNIIDLGNQNVKEYIANSVAKEMNSYGNIIALNLGTEIEFINTNGWLVKRYIAKQEITNIVTSDNIAGIIYRDKIEIINL